jgi:cell division protein FtsL
LKFRRIGLLILIAAVLVSAIGTIFSRHESRKLFVELQSLEKRQDDLNIEWGQLQLELSTLATHTRIENAARTRLDMTAPAPVDVVIVRP